MKTIPTTFRKDHHDHELIDRIGDFAIYRKFQPNDPNWEQFELMRVRVRKQDAFIAGNQVATTGDEYLPSTGEWGQYGWTLADITAVDAKIASFSWGSMSKELETA